MGDPGHNFLLQAIMPVVVLRKPNAANFGLVSLPLTVDKEIPRHRAAQLQPNFTVTVNGTIRDISASGHQVVIVIDDLKAE